MSQLKLRIKKVGMKKPVTREPGYATRVLTNGMYASVIADYEQHAESIADAAVLDRIKAMAAQFNAATAAVKETGNQELLDLCARHLYEMAADVIMSHLLLQNAAKDQSLFAQSLALYLNHAEADVSKHATLINNVVSQGCEPYRTA